MISPPESDWGGAELEPQQVNHTSLGTPSGVRFDAPVFNETGRGSQTPLSPLDSDSESLSNYIFPTTWSATTLRRESAARRPLLHKLPSCSPPVFLPSFSRDAISHSRNARHEFPLNSRQMPPSAGLTASDFCDKVRRHCLLRGFQNRKQFPYHGNFA